MFVFLIKLGLFIYLCVNVLSYSHFAYILQFLIKLYYGLSMWTSVYLFIYECFLFFIFGSFIFCLFCSVFVDCFLIRKKIKGCEFGSVRRILEHLRNGKSL